MRVINPNGMVERLNEHRKRPQLWDRYGRRKEGAPRSSKTLEIAVEQDRRSQVRDAIDPLRGRFFDLAT